MNADGVPGWYGKLPCRGDFVRRRLPAAFVEPWDTWLQQGLGHARSAIAGDWMEVYLVAPIWRFWLAPGVLNAAGWAGLLMPSVDRVGRAFPLTIAWPCEALEQVLAQRARFDAFDAAARRALDPAFGIDAFDAALADANARAAATGRAGLDDAARAVAAWRRRAGAGAPRSWWWAGEIEADAPFVAAPALPAPAGFVRLLGGAA